MKRSIRILLLGLGWLSALLLTTALSAAIEVRGVVTIETGSVVLDIIADTDGLALRGFGVGVKYDPAVLALESAGSYDCLWFLRGENGIVYPYTDATAPETGFVRLVGGRLDGSFPDEALAGRGILLGTLVFERTTTDFPEFVMDLANEDPFVNFASAEGDPLDGDVVFVDFEFIEGPIDGDGDGLPDSYEKDVFKGTGVSNGISDTDKDGDSDYEEFVKGSDPTDPHSRADFRIRDNNDGTVLLIWNGSTERVYNLLWSADAQTYETRVAGIPGADTEMDRSDAVPAGEAPGFYQLETKYPAGEVD